MTKVKVAVSIDRELLEWIKQQVKLREYGSVSHAVEKGLLRLKNEKKEKET